MTRQEDVPRWLWRAANWGLLAAVLAVAGLAGALALGLADSPRAGPLLWQDDFKHGTQRWTLRPPAGGSLGAADGALVAVFKAPGGSAEALAIGLTEAPRTDYTLEVAGAATSGETAAAYGLLYDWQDDRHYSAVFIDGNGYAQAFHQVGDNRQTLFEWQQWPHILFGTDANRVRVDVRGQTVTLSINDELLARVVFSWARVWASS